MLYYLYQMNAARVLLNVTGKSGLHLYYTNEESAKCEAAARSLTSKYPITIDTDGSLHNTRDGKPVVESYIWVIYSEDHKLYWNKYAGMWTTKAKASAYITEEDADLDSNRILADDKSHQLKIIKE